MQDANVPRKGLKTPGQVREQEVLVRRHDGSTRNCLSLRLESVNMANAGDHSFVVDRCQTMYVLCSLEKQFN